MNITYCSNMPSKSFTHHFNGKIAAAILSVALLALSGCSQVTSSGPYHNAIMRGQIVSLDGSNGVICIGQRDNAEVGQVLDVVRHIAEQHKGKSKVTTFKQEVIGQVKITRIVDQHYSDIDVISGNIRETDTVELLIK